MTDQPDWEIISAEFLKSATRKAHYPDVPLPEVAFAGRSNVGKSSLLNSLVRRKKLARTSQMPGLTQQINYFLINDRWHYVDLPGYGFAKAPPKEKEKWRRMIEEYLYKSEHLRLLILLLDCRRKPSDLDDQLVDFSAHAQIPILPVLTKADKLSNNKLRNAQMAIAKHYGMNKDELPIATSADKQRGRKALLETIYDFLEE